MNLHIPLKEKILIILNGYKIIIGLFFLIFGIIASGKVIGSFHLKSVYELEFGNIKKQTGEIINIYNAGLTINEDEFYGIEYKFKLDDFEDTGISYGTNNNLREGDFVTIEYAEGNPSANRVADMDIILGKDYLIIILFPLVIGLILIYLNTKKGLQNYKILVEGIVDKGKLIEKSPTLIRVNDRRVYKLVFQYEDKSKNKYTTHVKTQFTKKLEDENYESLIYLESEPKKVVIIDSLPNIVSKYIKKELSIKTNNTQ
ncbi:hypothetical protein [Aureivirga marina]|uniref:hypothetical protein n=1 Tax=Aureivirga marina TaxID=1182451 RepID=UPI0018CBD5B6|nr:hypothetical protein [Aureivirga marina]